jgi:CRP-like cAMP-binding protein/CheY-like chemotaxis protein
MIQIGQIIKQVPIFRMLGKESIDFIVERFKFKTFDTNDIVCKMGDPGDEMYVIISGAVNICVSAEDSESEQVVATLGPGDYFGEMALLTGEPRSASVVTTEPSEMFVLYKNDFDVILEKYPSISLSMGKIVSRRLRETLKRASSLTRINKIESIQGGPSGDLKDVPLIDLISFCESNSLTGTMTIESDENTGTLEFKSGELIHVRVGNTVNDQALDEALTWEKGRFDIKVKPLVLKKQDVSKEEIKNMLIVNNSLVVRKVIERAFRGLGYGVKTAKNMQEALTELQNYVPHIIISDVKLADGSGLEFLSKTRNIANIPFIFITDDSVKKEFENRIKEHGKAELTKTHEISEIVKLVENIL